MQKPQTHQTIEYSELVRDSLTLHLNTQADCCVPLNGTMKSKCFYDLKNYIDFENDDSIEYVTLSMQYAVICNSNYIFYSGNNTIKLTYNLNTYTHIVPGGNYNVNTFMAYLGTIFPTGMTVTFSSITNKFTFAYTLAAGQTWGFDLGTTCDYNMGFSGTLLTTGASVTSPYSVDFLPIDRYIVHCNVLSNGLMLTNNSAVSSGDVIASIPNNARLNSQIVYTGTGVEYLVRSIGNNGITITITNDNNQEIDFNNVSSYFVLQFNIYRRMIKRPLRFNNLISTINSMPKTVPENVIFEEN
jgi:hypothetical protein